jgi:hypothetical protein
MLPRQEGAVVKHFFSAWADDEHVATVVTEGKRAIELGPETLSACRASR